MRLLISFVFVASLAGCQYDRSFMQMDSNNGSPFMGLQLRVDASDRQADDAGEKDRVDLADSSKPAISSQGPFYLTGSSSRDSARLVPTALASEFTSNVVYSLPPTAAVDGQGSSPDVDAILRRMSAF